MNDRTRNLLGAGAALAVLVALDVASMTGPLPGSQWRSLAAQETEVWSRENEEQTYLEARRAVNRDECDRATELFQTLRDQIRRRRRWALHRGLLLLGGVLQLPGGRSGRTLCVLLDLASLHREARQYVPEGPSQRRGPGIPGSARPPPRIRRQLAEQGDPDAAEDVLRQSEAVLARDREALQEAERQFEARQREILRNWQQEQARAEQMWRERLARYQALDSTEIQEILRQPAMTIELAGALEALAALADTSAVPSTGIARRPLYARGLRERAGRRGLLSRSRELLRNEVQPGPGRGRHPPGVRGRAD